MIFLHSCSCPSLFVVFVTTTTVLFPRKSSVKIELAGSDHEVVENFSLSRLLDNIDFDGVLRNETVDCNGARLTDPVAAVLRLQVHRRIPIRVEEDDGVRADEVQANSACPSGENHGKDSRVAVELLDPELPFVRGDGAVEAEIGKTQESEEPLENREHSRELGENEHPVAFRREPLEEREENEKLAAILDDPSRFRKMKIVRQKRPTRLERSD